MKENKFDYDLMCIKWEIAKYKSMQNVLSSKKDISIFNAQKSLYIPLKTANPLLKKVLIYIFKIIVNKQLNLLNNKLRKYESTKN